MSEFTLRKLIYGLIGQTLRQSDPMRQSLAPVKLAAPPSARTQPSAALMAAELFGCASARQILAEALCLPESVFSADTKLESLAIDSLVLECIALHAEEIAGREFDRTEIRALGTVRDLELILFSPVDLPHP
jgi:hypothetical protein